MTRLLAFDTSTQTMSVALALPGEVLLYDGEGGAAASGQLITQAQRLMADAGLNWNRLDAIAFGRGPGAFTGLRTACSVAQGLALGADKPVLPLDSLMLVAQDAFGSPSTDDVSIAPLLWVVTDARMGEVYAGQYRWQVVSSLATTDHGHWQTCTAPLLSSPRALLSLWGDQPPPALAGNALREFAEVFAPLSWPVARLFPQAQVRAQALAALAKQAWVSGAAVDAALALPLYVRDKVAQTTAERNATRLVAVHSEGVA